jgi:hypothetical protein
MTDSTAHGYDEGLLNIVKNFIDERPAYVSAARVSVEAGADYHRWQGHMEARRQLAQALGWTVPFEPTEKTEKENS